MSLFLVGCDTLQGVSMPVHPEYEGDWLCATQSLGQEGYLATVDSYNQLSVTKEGQYLFSVAPSKNGAMQVYLYSMNAPLPCSVADQSYQGMRIFLRAMQSSCGYVAQDYSVSFECSSNQ
ncbi:hypothetical protein ACTXGQ_09685 [Marinobacter sp. 1Y8]